MPIVDFVVDFFRRRRRPPRPPTPVPTPTPTPVPVEDISAKLLKAHNELRRKHGRVLPVLVIDPRLQKAAQLHCEDMYSNGIYSHYGSDGSSPWLRMNRQKFYWQDGAENIAGGSTVEEVMDQWENSTDHLINLLGNFQCCGFGRKGQYWCALFANERTNLNSVSDELQDNKDENN